MTGRVDQGQVSRVHAGPEDARLRGWKEIARWFGVDERTVKRWEVSRGLPIRRVPGEARAPVFAYEAELSAWLASRPAADEEATAEPGAEIEQDAAAPALARASVAWWQGWRGIAVAAVFALLTAVVLAWQSLVGPGQALAERHEEGRAVAERGGAGAQADDVRRLAVSQVAEINERLERQPGTVRLRARLALEAATVLARVARLPDAPPALARDAAEAYRRLAIVDAAADRPSLRDRTAARAALAQALRLVASDTSQPGRWLRARILADAARQAAADGAAASAPAMLAAADAAIGDGAAAHVPAALRDELRLARGEVAAWQGDYARAAALAGAIAQGPGPPVDIGTAMRRLRGLDQAAEAHFYAGDKALALAEYRRAAAAAAADALRWPMEPRFRWALQRQQWNLGTTLVDLGQAGEALVVLAAARRGWMAMAAADPEDESLAAWVRVIRISYGQALSAAGRSGDAIAELGASVADRRLWLAAQPVSNERRRAVVVGLSALADTLGMAGRRREA
jgi:hypothetical protein